MQIAKQNYPYVWAHRGASGYAPENTLIAFSKAVEMGAFGVELDVQLTKDGQVVVVHDEWLDRVSNGSGFVKDHTLEELKALNFNGAFPSCDYAQLPTFEEVLQLLAPSGLMIDIELKTAVFNYPNLANLTMDLVEKYEMREKVIYSSFKH